MAGNRSEHEAKNEYRPTYEPLQNKLARKPLCFIAFVMAIAGTDYYGGVKKKLF